MAALGETTRGQIPRPGTGGRSSSSIWFHFERLLSNIIARPNALLDDLESLSEAEQAQQAINRTIREKYNYERFKSVIPKAIDLLEG